MTDTLPTAISPTSTQPASSGNELEHITQEMYKKNFELADKNKTLAILRRIDEIILSTVTDVNQIAQQVADVVSTEGEFKAVGIFLIEKKEKVLKQIAISKTPLVEKVKSQTGKQLYCDKVDLNNVSSVLIKVINEKIMQTVHALTWLVIPFLTDADLKAIEQIGEIKSSVIHPLIVRDEVIGAIVISMGESEETLFQYQKELIDRLVGVIGVAMDNALLYQKLQDANERLKSLDKLKDEFVSLASHELRTPMTAIKSYLWLVLNQKEVGELNQKQRLYIDRTYQSTERLIRLVNEMLNVSRIESGRLTLNLKPVDIVKLAQDAAADVSPNATTAGITLVVTSPLTQMPNVTADSEKLKEIFINLIGNSLKFTPSGGKIEINFERAGDQIQTNVIDNGKGIKPEDMGTLFHKFGMIEGNYGTRPLGQGSGLGLYITKSIIEMHGGKVNVFSEGENKGTKFSFTLNIAKEGELPQEKEVQTTSEDVKPTEMPKLESN